MNQSELRKLIPALKIAIKPRHRNLRNKDGPEGRLKRIGGIVTSLIKEERIELIYDKADEARGYTERLITEAIKHGDTHQETMELANFYIREKQLIHKLFKVLVPRYKNYQDSYTNLFVAPTKYGVKHIGLRPLALLELKGNPFPPMKPERIPTHNWIHNILFEEAKRENNAKKSENIDENQF